MKRFSEEHEWVEVAEDIASVGITAYAAKELGEITFVELPEVNASFEQGDVLAVVESVKAAADVFCPVGGTVCEVNESLDEQPELINASAEMEAWICRLKGFRQGDVDALMTEDEYEEFTAQAG